MGKIGRRLLLGEEAHHVNQSGDKTDNRPENIEVKLSHADHAVEHRTTKNKDRLRMPGAPNPMALCACGCGANFLKFDGEGRPRKFISGHNTSERNRRG